MSEALAFDEPETAPELLSVKGEPVADADCEEALRRLDQRRQFNLTRLPEGEDVFGTTTNTLSKLIVECPKCNQQLGASRFALHYEKCLNKASRVQATANSVNATNTQEPSPSQTPSSDSDWSTPCSVCRAADTPESMVMCDGCSRVFHTWCLVPRLSEVPEGVWLCRRCNVKLVPPADETYGLSKRMRQQRLSAKDKVKKGRFAVAVDALEFYCDLCNTIIEPDQSRFRCLMCAEFDVCVNCKGKGGSGHRSTHPMAELRV